MKTRPLLLNKKIQRLFLFAAIALCLLLLVKGPVFPKGPFSIKASSPKAVILSLARESDLFALKKTLENFHLRFTRRFPYPILIVTDGAPFSLRFRNHIMAIFADNPEIKVTFSTIEPGHWDVPEWIDGKRLNRSLEDLVEKRIVHGGEVSYRQMCRWFSGFFMWHKEILSYDWYWRIEPGVEFTCDIREDPFVSMRDRQEIYGFVITLLEIRETIPSLWNVTKAFLKSHPQYYHHDQKRVLPFFVNKEMEYNYCHFWDNFEIARLDFYRSKRYQKYFHFLDERGLFFYERTGDAPVHSLAVGLFLRKRQVRFFESIGYMHPPLQHCPLDEGERENEFSVYHRRTLDDSHVLRLKERWGQCYCDPAKNFDQRTGSCLGRWKNFPPDLDDDDDRNEGFLDE